MGLYYDDKSHQMKCKVFEVHHIPVMNLNNDVASFSIIFLFIDLDKEGFQCIEALVEFPYGMHD